MGAGAYLKQLEDSDLTDGFWDVALPAALETTSLSSPYFQTYIASQVASGARGFLSKAITVATMRQQSGDIHHLVPKDYLQKNGFPDRGDYNQVANFALTETSINVSISNRPPADYMSLVDGQIVSGALKLGEIVDPLELERNLAENAIPHGFRSVDATGFPDFLVQRRQLMASAVRRYYELL